MYFYVWLFICLCFVIYVTAIFIKSVKTGKPFWRVFKEWSKNIIDIFSGGG